MLDTDIVARDKDTDKEENTMNAPPSITVRQDRYGGILIDAEYVQGSQVELRALAGSLLEPIKKAFEDPAFEADFQAWLKEQKEEHKHGV